MRKGVVSPASPNPCGLRRIDWGALDKATPSPRAATDWLARVTPVRRAARYVAGCQLSDSTVDASIDLGPCEPLGQAAIERGPIRRVGQCFLVGLRVDGASNESVDRGGFAHCAMIADVTLPH